MTGIFMRHRKHGKYLNTAKSPFIYGNQLNVKTGKVSEVEGNIQVLSPIPMKNVNTYCKIWKYIEILWNIHINYSYV